jgi:hypothetical protein
MTNFFIGLEEEQIVEEVKDKPFSPFDWLKQITVTKSDWSSFTPKQQEGFNAFIINKALSFNPHYLPIVEIAMTYPMPNDKLYDFYKDIIPKQQIWNKWVKSNMNWNDEEIQLLATYFECSTREIKDNYSLLESLNKDIIISEIKGFEGKVKKKKKK